MHSEQKTKRHLGHEAHEDESSSSRQKAEQRGQ